MLALQLSILYKLSISMSHKGKLALVLLMCQSLPNQLNVHDINMENASCGQNKFTTKLDVTYFIYYLLIILP